MMQGETLRRARSNPRSGAPTYGTSSTVGVASPTSSGMSVRGDRPRRSRRARGAPRAPPFPRDLASTSSRSRARGPRLQIENTTLKTLASLPEARRSGMIRLACLDSATATLVGVRLAVGDVVVYAAHGVGRVAAREKRMVL